MRKHWYVGSLTYGCLTKARQAAKKRAEAHLGEQVPVYECVEAWVVSLPEPRSMPLEPQHEPE